MLSCLYFLDRKSLPSFMVRKILSINALIMQQPSISPSTNRDILHPLQTILKTDSGPLNLLPPTRSKTFMVSLFTEYTPDLNQKLESSCSSIRLFLLHISLLNYFLGQIFTTKHSMTLFLPNGSHSLYYFVSIHLHFLFLHLALNQMILLPASPDICPCLGDFLVATAGGHYWGG